MPQFKAWPTHNPLDMLEGINATHAADAAIKFAQQNMAPVGSPGENPSEELRVTVENEHGVVETFHVRREIRIEWHVSWISG